MSRQGDTGAAVSAADVRLRGVWLVVARLVSAVIVAFALALFAVSGVIDVTRLRAICAHSCLAGQLTLAQFHTLRALGLSLDAYATIAIMVTALTSLVWFTAAAIVYWRRSDTLFLLLLATQLVTQGASNLAHQLPIGHPAWQAPVVLLVGVNDILFCLFLALFPTGQFAPRWMGWFVIPASIVLPLQEVPGTPGILGLAFPITFAVLIVGQIYRFRAVSTGIQRQQTKWVILGIGGSFVVQIALALPPLFDPGLASPDALYPLLSIMIAQVALTLGPIAFVVAVLRYRLYDFDILINRALVYGTLTAILAAIYFGVVIGAQSVIQTLTGQRGQQTLFIVASTLLVAALFNPLRRWLQSAIDRRFYRRKYDVARTLATFGTTVRTETDLGELSAQLLAVVGETMQPVHVSLWLRSPARPTEQLPLPVESRG